jgi:hypothetical protein
VTAWAGTAGNYVEITAVQLEKGTIATTFERRPYAIEYALCQRYARLSATAIAQCSAASSTTLYGIVYFTTAMRTAPTFTSSNCVFTFDWHGIAASGSVSTIQLVTGGKTNETSGLLYVTGSGWTANETRQLLYSGSWVIFDAEMP